MKTKNLDLSQKITIPIKLAKPRIIEAFAYTSALITGLVLAAKSFSNLYSGIWFIPVWFFLSLSIYILNDITDTETDSLNKTTNPVIDHGIGKRRAIATFLGLSSLPLLISALINLEFFLICAAFLGLGIIYSLPPIQLKKRLGGKQITVGVGMVLSILAGGAVYNSYPSILLYGALLISPFTFICSCINDLKDMKGDEKTGRSSIALKIGIKRTIDLGIIGILLTYILIIPGYLYYGLNLGFVLIMIIVSFINLRSYIGSRSSTQKQRFAFIRKLGGISIPIFQISILLGLI